MSVKEQLIAAFEQLPDDATWEDAEKRVRILHGIDQAERDIDAGKGIPHEEVVRRFESWLRK